MKKVINGVEETVSVSDIKNKSVVGVTLGSQFGYGVVRDVHQGGRVCFRLIGMNLDITGTSPHNSKRELCEHILSIGGEVFLFVNDVELFTWMVKKYR